VLRPRAQDRAGDPRRHDARRRVLLGVRAARGLPSGARAGDLRVRGDRHPERGGRGPELRARARIARGRGSAGPAGERVEGLGVSARRVTIRARVGSAMRHGSPTMQNDEIRDAVRAVIGSVAPGADLGALRPDRPLREQIDLDSMDWLNVLAALQERLAIAIPEPDYGRLGTLDAIVAYVADRR